ncbi:MAG: hypothetical protein RR324_10070 [Cellulosilyticaceae bacterium]|uniref:hypothetical protein n=1 Tax=Niameybacter sp. TaxID=2033640 RepID=UPI002FCA4E4C
MHITVEVKADKELLEVLAAIKEALTGDKPPAKSESMTVEAFVADQEAEAQEYTLEEVRAKLAALSRAGKRDEVNKLIKTYGVVKLTDLSEEHYNDIMQKAGEL